MLSANAVYSTEPKDGTVIGNFSENLVLQQLTGDPGAQFDSAKFQWLGSATKGLYACVARTDSGVQSIQDTLGGRELVVGTEGPGSDIHSVPAVIKSVLGANFKLVPGYDGFSKVRLATEAKEVDGFCATFLVIASQAKSLLEGDNPTARIILVTGERPPDHPLLKGVPAWESLAKTDGALQLLRVADAHRQISKPYAVAPEVPADRVAALRQALAAAYADPKLVEEVEKVGQDVQFSSGEEVTRTVQQVLNTPPAVVAELKEILK
jgi:tripartite-type tricarboxylate transporter receptor subunit TctC